MYTRQRAAQIAGYFLAKESSRRMPYMKLIKLMYLADREALARFGRSISDDRLVSMPRGPVLSATLDLLNGTTESDDWSQWIGAAARFQVELAKEGIDRDSFDEISNAELAILDSVWKEFGHMTPFELQDWTHQHCAEWVDPNGSSKPITKESILQALGRTTEQAKAIADEIIVRRKLDQVLESVR